MPTVRSDRLDYDLPERLIAQQPAEPRDASRLMLVDRAAETITDAHFRDLPDLLDPTDLVVLNSTRVLPARIRFRRASGGAGEALLLDPLGDDRWAVLIRPAARLHEGETVRAGALAIRIEHIAAAGEAEVTLLADGSIDEALARAGEMPLPPYIHEPLADPDRYQTVYADTPGSAAAPTAGLHFTPELLARLEARVETLRVDLRVGLDTFRPVTAGDLDEHPMHSEEYRIDPAVRRRIDDARAAGRRVVAIGTTSVRVLETVADPAAPDRGRTELLIQPGYRFRTVGALVTNFHLPRSTLLALVMALAGEELTRRAYAEAIAREYRFYSLGDAMLIR
jgi:S-adenosylmethionine:tRNA ribosyltransferase-isomerase